MNYSNLLENIKKVHFVGIGGSGMAPLARVLLAEGYTVTGSDIYESETLMYVRDLGIPVFWGHKEENVADAELVVFSAAIKKENPEIVAAGKANIPILERAALLGVVAQKYKNCVAVAGTHGKTTTTAMLTQILVEAGMDPTAIIGGRFPYIDGNSRIGNSQTIVCEACEYVNSFLQLRPDVSVILNIDADHLDYFKSLANIQKSFQRFAMQTGNLILLNGDDENVKEIAKNIKTPKLTFGLKNFNDYYVEENIDPNLPQTSFNIVFQEQHIAKVNLNVPGTHNIYNALAAAAIAHSLGANINVIGRALSEFTGVHRRFEFLGKPRGITVADDFAHHPTALKAVLSTAKKMGFKRVWAVFEPHTYSRTYQLFDDFASTLALADRVVLSEILAVREENIYNIFAKDLAEKIPGCVWFKNFAQIADYIAKNAATGDLILTLGGGNIYKCAHMILDALNNI